MRYLKAINIWDSTMQNAVLSGQLRLQSGQWLKCGSGKLSRFVAVKGQTLWVAHWQGSSKATNKRFKTLLKASKQK